MERSLKECRVVARGWLVDVVTFTCSVSRISNMASVSLVVNLSISVMSIPAPALGIHLLTKWLASGLIVSSFILRGCFGCTGAGVSSVFALLIVFATESSVSVC